MHNRNSSQAIELSDVSVDDMEVNNTIPPISTISRRSTASTTNSPLNSPTDQPPIPKTNKWRAALALVLWYFFSIVLSVYNKFMFSKSGMDFRFPIITTSLHQLAQILLSLGAIYFLKLPASSLSKQGRLKVVPASLASAGDIGLGNSSLLVVTLSFYTMLKSSALGFVLLFSVLFKLEKPSIKLVFILVVMTLGVFLMAAGEANFSWLGFVLVLGASCLSGLRWALVKLLLNGGEHSEGEIKQKQISKPHPVQTIMLLSPGMFLGLFLIGCLVEGPVQFGTAKLWQEWSLVHGVVALLLPGVLAFCMTWAEFDLLNTTGPLALAIGGICKEVATIIISVIVFQDKLSVINTVGLMVTIASIGMYHYHRNVEN